LRQFCARFGVESGISSECQTVMQHGPKVVRTYYVPDARDLESARACKYWQQDVLQVKANQFESCQARSYDNESDNQHSNENEKYCNNFRDKHDSIPSSSRKKRNYMEEYSGKALTIAIF